MMDAIIIELPLVHGTNEMMPSIEDLDEDKRLDLKLKVNKFLNIYVNQFLFCGKGGFVVMGFGRSLFPTLLHLRMDHA